MGSSLLIGFIAVVVTGILVILSVGWAAMLLLGVMGLAVSYVKAVAGTALVYLVVAMFAGALRTYLE